MAVSGDGQASRRSVTIHDETMYRHIVAQFPSIRLTVGSADGGIVASWVGEAVAALSGYEVGDLESDPELWLNLVHPADRERVENAYRDIRSGKPLHEQYRVYRKDGRMRRVVEMAAPAALHNGMVRWMRCVTDITDAAGIKETEDALRENRQLLAAIQDSLAVNLAVIDKDGTIIAVNERWRRYARENGDPTLEHTCEGINYLDVCRRATGPRSEGADEALRGLQSILDGEADGSELEYPCAFSECYQWYLMRAAPLDGGQRGAVVLHIDITKHKQAEDALSESEARYHSLVENLDAVVFRMSKDLELRAVAGQVWELLGYSEDRFLTEPLFWRDLVHPDDLATARETMNVARASRLPRTFDARVRHESGQVRWIGGTLTPIFDENGEFVYYDGVFLDITERVEAQEREARYARRMRALTEISQAFGSTLDDEQILDAATQKVCETLDCSTAGVTVEPGTGRLLHLSVCCSIEHQGEYEVESTDRELRGADFTVEGVFGAAKIEPRLVPDLRQVSPEVARFADERGLGPGMIVPVAAGEDMAGLLVCARPPEQQFDQEDLWFLTEVASHASAALANAALYRRQTLIAETLQRSLISTEPAVEFLDIATLYAPAPGEAAVGGDFFDIFRVDHKRAALVIGDVSGKGVGAAIHTAEAKYMLRAFAHQNADPIHVITSLNAALYAYLPHETFITLACFFIDAREHTMTYINAGHETCFVLRGREHEILEIGANGPMLGVTTKVAYAVGQTALEPGDMLFCYTDGVIDVQANGERFGYRRLREAVAAAPVDNSRQLIERVMEQVQAFGPAKQTDDQVVVALRMLA